MSGQGQTNQQRRRQAAIRDLSKIVASARRPGVHPKKKLMEAAQIAEQVALALLKGGL